MNRPITPTVAKNIVKNNILNAATRLTSGFLRKNRVRKKKVRNSRNKHTWFDADAFCCRNNAQSSRPIACTLVSVPCYLLIVYTNQTASHQQTKARMRPQRMSNAAVWPESVERSQKKSLKRVEGKIAEDGVKCRLKWVATNFCSARVICILP